MMRLHFNWKHVLFHAIGIGLYGYAARALLHLMNIGLSEAVRLSTITRSQVTAGDLVGMQVQLAMGFSLGALLGAGCCLIADRKIGGSWINSAIAFFLVFLATRHLLLVEYYERVAAYLSDNLFAGWPLHTVMALLLMTAGSFFVFRIAPLYHKESIA